MQTSSDLIYECTPTAMVVSFHIFWLELTCSASLGLSPACICLTPSLCVGLCLLPVVCSHAHMHTLTTVTTARCFTYLHLQKQQHCRSNLALDTVNITYVQLPQRGANNKQRITMKWSISQYSVLLSYSYSEIRKFGSLKIGISSVLLEVVVCGSHN